MIYTSKDYLTGEYNLLLMEKITIEKALKRTKGVKIDAAKLLEITPRTLSDKMKRHNIIYKHEEVKNIGKSKEADKELKRKEGKKADAIRRFL